MHHVALRPDDQRVSQFGKLKLPSLSAKGDVATGAKLGNDDGKLGDFLLKTALISFSASPSMRA